MTTSEFISYIQELEKIVEEGSTGKDKAKFFLASDITSYNVEEIEKFINFYTRNR